jgi:hypothetical protein
MLDQALGLNGSSRTSANEEKLIAILESLKEATARGLELTEQLMEHSKRR